ncbi:MAG: hypothetical protein D6766_10125 [Verrucomicrobia bacterium]|nr:MAG: hypothetical protein D6766_10125 [Verrucomicrobiota bacterium]
MSGFPDMASTGLRQGRDRGRRWIEVESGGCRELFLTMPALPGESAADLFQRFYAWIEAEPHWRILRQEVFGVVGGPAAGRGSLHRLDGSHWPVTWVEQGNGQGSPVAGLQVHAIGGVETRPVRWGGRTVGVTYEDERGRHCVLGGLLPPDPTASREAQAEAVFDLAERVLAEAGFRFEHVYRTWFYLDDILEWYDAFNAVRNRFFQQRGIYDRLVPASTGIGGNNPAGAALTGDLMAVIPASAELRLEAVPSPLQCPALEYGSSFSRAVEVAWPGQRRLLVSGTASIEPGGATAHVGDVEAQVATTMEVVHAILRSRGMDWADTTRAIAYFKHAHDTRAFEKYCRRQGLPDLPVVVTKNDVCRDDLLFELELDAIRVG